LGGDGAAIREGCVAAALELLAQAIADDASAEPGHGEIPPSA
jgi:hypothetical protein